MKIIKEGEKGKAVCQDCGLTSTTYSLRNVEFSDKSGIVKNVLAGVCDKCDEVVSVPRQSTPQIKSEYHKARKSLESRVPAHFLDILNLASARIDTEIGFDFSKHLILYYVHSLNTGRMPTTKLKELLVSDIALAPSSKRLSLKVSHRTETEISAVVKKAGLTSNSDLIKSIILKINEDIVQPESPAYIDDLKTLASAFG